MILRRPTEEKKKPIKNKKVVKIKHRCLFVRLNIFLFKFLNLIYFSRSIWKKMASITLSTMMMMCLWLFVVSVWATPIPSSSEPTPPVHQPSDSTSFFNLTVLHINDIHCRFEEANKFGGSCTPQESAAGKCFGGYARLVHQSRVIREENPNTIFLAAGDFFQGTMWVV